jgi:hypothetical protein
MWTAWRRYWFAPAPCFDLAVLRIVACGLQLYLVRNQYFALQEHAALDDAVYDPIVIFNVYHVVLGWGFRPDFEILQMVFFASIAAGALSLVGLLTNFSLLVFAATSVYLQAYLYSFGDFHHPEAVMMIALSVLALSPAGRVLSVDAWLRRHTRADTPSMLDLQSEFAGWPIKLIQWFFVLMYFSAVTSKLWASGLDWANGYTLQYYLARDGLRWGSDLGVWLSQHHLLVLLGQIGVLLFQGSFALAVIFPKLRWIYVPAGIILHLFIFLTMRAPFPQWIALYTAFIPWSKAVRLIRSRWQASRRLAPSPS